MPVPKLDRPTVYDGSKGTHLIPELLKIGKTSSDIADWLNLLAPEIVRQSYFDYINAGSEVIETNSFNGNRLRLGKYGLADKVHEINHTAARLAREAASDRVAVSGAMGPSGKMLVMGEVTADEVSEAFAEQAKALEEGGVDLLHVQTMADMNEAVAAVGGVRSVSKLPLMLTMTFDTGNAERGLRTMMGVKPAELVRKGEDLGLLAVGNNCGKGLDGYQRVFQDFLDAKPQIAIIAKVNAGIPTFDGQKLVYEGTPEKMAQYALWCAERGIQLIGVCCGGDPEHIGAIAKALAEYRR